MKTRWSPLQLCTVELKKISEEGSVGAGTSSERKAVVAPPQCPTSPAWVTRRDASTVVITMRPRGKAPGEHLDRNAAVSTSEKLAAEGSILMCSNCSASSVAALWEREDGTLKGGHSVACLSVTSTTQHMSSCVTVRCGRVFPHEHVRRFGSSATRSPRQDYVRSHALALALLDDSFSTAYLELGCVRRPASSTTRTETPLAVPRRIGLVSSPGERSAVVLLYAGLGVNRDSDRAPPSSGLIVESTHLTQDEWPAPHAFSPSPHAAPGPIDTVFWGSSPQTSRGVAENLPRYSARLSSQSSSCLPNVINFHSKMSAVYRLHTSPDVWGYGVSYAYVRVSEASVAVRHAHNPLYGSSTLFQLITRQVFACPVNDASQMQLR
ncbi:unnamed protein product [Rangifer tarandus platyrhynchus]|uniref:Uncharacterized protein n=1 Tax=Rangifer tarandus platyrhynchus TaxID=3082113 RepID=A0ABN8XIM5_RANTA|nr:unnamed protein product [Rangifer tarandus platyrhynchus]